MLKGWLPLVIAGFVAAHLLASLGVRASVGGFKIEHLYVGFLLMVAGFASRRMWLFWLGSGVALDDFVFGYLAGEFTPRI